MEQTPGLEEKLYTGSMTAALAVKVLHHAQHEENVKAKGKKATECGARTRDLSRVKRTSYH